MDYVDFLPIDLLELGIDVSQLKINEIGWKSSEAIKVINFLVEKGYGILGGDVYKMVNGLAQPAYANWSIDKEDSIIWEQYVTNSKEKAISYIEFFRKRNGDDYYYVIVYANEAYYLKLVEDLSPSNNIGIIYP